ncbi:MAG TPA: UbiH/UbiF/VisC/COQ6 family ubiquinone biosynthesis hydroxylase [Gammaproteobacteria bacterium]|nr:UbiH/UbiF/VisC/COQ6 family ubiquinone biosynthesis hydroxylase [Gammaproteobacteria bacterium]
MSSGYDVIVVGGSNVGATLACALGQAGLRVAVVEARQAPAAWSADTVDLRVYSITRASQRIFAALGVWPGMVSRGVSPFREMHVWDAGGSGTIHFDCTAIGEDTLGHIIEQRVIQAALHERLRELPTVELVCPAELAAIEHGSGAATAVLADGRRLRAPLLVGADGVQSQVRAMADIATEVHEYLQRAVVAPVATEHWHRETAWQRFLPGGPLAFLPLRDGRCSIVWSLPSEQADRHLELPEPGFRRALEEASEGALGAITEVGERVAFPLRRMHARSYLAERIALVGDAAHVIHPLAGQGANLGLLDAATLAQVVTEAHAGGRDIGDHRVLRRYERWRRGDNLAMMSAMDGFKSLFGNSLLPVRQVRSLGLRLVDGAGPLKSFLIRHAMGLSGDLPRLAMASPAPE